MQAACSPNSTKTIQDRLSLVQEKSFLPHKLSTFWSLLSRESRNEVIGSIRTIYACSSLFTYSGASPVQTFRLFTVSVGIKTYILSCWLTLCSHPHPQVVGRFFGLSSQGVVKRYWLQLTELVCSVQSSRVSAGFDVCVVDLFHYPA